MAKCKACGAFYASDIRSSKEHRRTWKMITLAEDHWPEQYEFQPEGDDHLRQWLTCKAGQYLHRTYEVPHSSDPMYQAVIDMMRGAYEFTGSDEKNPRYVFEKITGVNKLTIYRAKSWSYDHGMTQSDFHDMAENINLILMPMIIGRTGNELLEMSEGSYVSQ